jgi:hypothetical protein
MDWAHEELKASHRKGYGRGWGISTTYHIRDGWVYVGLDNRRVYAPLEHPELPSQFASVAGTPRKLEAFLETYGHLGFAKLPRFGRRGARPPGASIEALLGEPVDWIDAQARTVAWCLNAAEAVKSETATINRFRRLWQEFPDIYAIGRAIHTRASSRLERVTARSGSIYLWEPVGRKKPKIRERVGWLVADLLTANLRGTGHRTVEWTTPPGSRSRFVTEWRVNSLVEPIYMLVANAVAEGVLATCEACGAPFIQTDARQRHCPKSTRQAKSPCAVRKAVRKFRAKPRVIPPRPRPRPPASRGGTR